MTNTEIGRASDSQLRARVATLDLLIDQTDDQDRGEDLQAEQDLIWDELAGRAHDIEDPSSGLGLHQPS
jgi:hypothetical protein